VQHLEGEGRVAAHAHGKAPALITSSCVFPIARRWHRAAAARAATFSKKSPRSSVASSSSPLADLLGDAHAPLWITNMSRMWSPSRAISS
jgi:hypothetical protein